MGRPQRSPFFIANGGGIPAERDKTAPVARIVVGVLY